jgi:hypothetical protein
VTDTIFFYIYNYLHAMQSYFSDFPGIISLHGKQDNGSYGKTESDYLPKIECFMQEDDCQQYGYQWIKGGQTYDNGNLSPAGGTKIKKGSQYTGYSCQHCEQNAHGVGLRSESDHRQSDDTHQHSAQDLVNESTLRIDILDSQFREKPPETEGY